MCMYTIPPIDGNASIQDGTLFHVISHKELSRAFLQCSATVPRNQETRIKGALVLRCNTFNLSAFPNSQWKRHESFKS